MAIRAAFLTLFLLFLAGAGSAAAKAGCLRCHEPHYSERGSCTGCHLGDERSDRLGIAHRDLIRGKYASFAIPGSQPLQRGEKLLKTLGCRRCHTSARMGNRLATDLDRLPAKTSPEKLAASIEKPALFMPDFACEAEQTADLVTVILAGAAKAGPRGPERPRVVHFADVQRRWDNVFENRCGPCHKVLTRKMGPLGKGNAGPNLSGLFSAHYPASSVIKGRWTAARVEKWLSNPRALRAVTQMRPVSLKKDEFQRLLAVLDE